MKTRINISKKIMILFLCAILLFSSLALSACSKSTGTGTSFKYVIKTMSIFGAGNENKSAYDNALKKFMENNKDVHIVDVSSYATEPFKKAVIQSFLTGSEADVIFFNENDAVKNILIAQDKLVPISEIREEYPNFCLDSYDPSYSEYFIPINAAVDGLFVNIRVLNKLVEKNVIENKLPETVEELLALIKNIQEYNDESAEKTGKIVPIYCKTEKFMALLEYLILYFSRNNSLNIIDDNDPSDYSSALNYLYTIKEEGAFGRKKGEIETEDVFLRSGALFRFDGNDYIQTVAEQNKSEIIGKDVVEFCGFLGLEQLIGGVNGGFYITRKAWENKDKREKAIEFVSYMAQKEVAVSFQGNELLNEKSNSNTLLENSLFEKYTQSEKVKSLSIISKNYSYEILVNGIYSIFDTKREELNEKIVSILKEYSDENKAK